VFRNSRDDDPDAFLAYVKGWAVVNLCEEEGRIFYFRDHLAGEAMIWAESIPWDTGFGGLCELFERRFKGKINSIVHIKNLARHAYKEGSFLAYLDQMKRLAYKAGLPENVLVAFALSGLPDDIGGSLLMNASGELTWLYLYNACEGLDCSNRAMRSLGNLSNLNSERMEICKIQGVIKCWFCGVKGHVKKDCLKLRNLRRKQVKNIRAEEGEEEEEAIIKNKGTSFYRYVRSLCNITNGDLVVKVKILDYKISALVDSGAWMNLIKSKYVRGRKLKKTHS